jgi:putative transposase
MSSRAKYRRKILTRGVSQWLRPAFEQLRKYSPDIEFIEVGIDRDHVHLHMIIPPRYAVSQVVNRIKVNTSRQMKQKFSFLEKVYWGTESVWSTGYFVSTVLSVQWASTERPFETTLRCRGGKMPDKRSSTCS